MDVASFAEIAATFEERVGRVVWCNMATIDTRGRPRSRVVHPLWDGPVGWLGTRRHSFKARHLAQNPHISLAYIADLAKPIYVDCRAEWVDDPEAKQRFWQLALSTPPPLGYDPAPIFGSVDDPGFGLLRLTPWRLELADFGGEHRVWHSGAA